MATGAVENQEQMIDSSRPRSSRAGTRAIRWVGDRIVDNPIFLRELRRRMRGRALFVAMIAYIAIMCAVAFVIIFAKTMEIRTSEVVNIHFKMKEMSDQLFTWVAVIQGVLVLLVGPIITAGIATSEKEKKTLDFLQVTTLRPAAFVIGALASTMLYILLVLLCALPVLSITFLFGGRAPSDIAASFGSLLLLSMILSAGGLWIASIRERSRSAQSALLFVVGIIIVNFLLLRFFAGRMISLGGGGSALLPFSSFAPGGQVSIFGMSVRAWHADIIGAIIVIGFLALLAARRIFNPENRALNYWQGLVFFALAQLLVVAQLWGGRLAQADLIPAAGIVTWALLMIAVLVYQTGRVEMGNEVWRIKRRFRFLRGIDESVLHQLMLIGLWVLIAQWWIRNTAAHAAQPRATHHLWVQTLWFVTANALFAGALGRFFAHLTRTRSSALRWTFLTLLALYVILPLAIIFLVKLDSSNAVQFMGRLTVLSHVPWVYLTQLGGENVIRELGLVSFEGGIQQGAPLVYLALAGVFYLLAFSLHRSRRIDPDYGVADRPERPISEEPFIRSDIFQILRRDAAELD
jgi:ABC-2 type transport system permease protein